MPPASADRRASGRAGASGSSGAARTRMLALLEPVVRAAGYDLEDVTVSSAGRRSLVRVVVDADGGIDLDAVADVSRAVSDALDGSGAGDDVAGPFVLEVTSPGVDRPLTLERHWRRATGRLVRVDAGEHTVTGRVVTADDGTVTLDVDGAEQQYPLADLGPGAVQVEFARAPREQDENETGES